MTYGWTFAFMVDLLCELESPNTGAYSWALHAVCQQGLRHLPGRFAQNLHFQTRCRRFYGAEPVCGLVQRIQLGPNRAVGHLAPKMQSVRQHVPNAPSPRQRESVL